MDAPEDLGAFCPEGATASIKNSLGYRKRATPEG
jgi:hypothetical protein